MKTTDFTGSYDYEREEAKSEAESFLSYASEYTEQENRVRADKLLAHWSKCLCADGLKDFKEEWNQLVPQFPI